MVAGLRSTCTVSYTHLNYVETVKEDSTGYRIYIKDGVPLNRSDAEAYVQLDVTEKNVKEKKKMCIRDRNRLV